jgi:signal transduction histidine kinase
MTPTTRLRTSRTLLAAGLLTVLLGGLLGGWFVSGWHDLQMRQAALREGPAARAAARARDAAQTLRADLDTLLTREAQRPYFHYQNLMHDPRTSGVNVSPSPLSTGDHDELVLGYFQIDPRGRTTTPTINEDVPELSAPGELAANRRFRDVVARDLAPVLKPPAAKLPPAAASAAPPADDRSPRQASQVVTLDPGAYAQNAFPNQVYSQQVGTTPPALPEPFRPPSAIQAPRQAPPGRPAAVTIIVSPFELRTHALFGVPTLVAVRQVQTPDGNLTQGFVISRPNRRLWSMPGLTNLTSAVVPSDDPASAFAPGWAVAVQPAPDEQARADAETSAEARRFLGQFAAAAAIALFAAGGVLFLVRRAESLARERSQFAAAAAHELRTPLAGLQLYGDMLAEGLGDSSKVREYARHISEDAARLGRVVSNMLGFSQLERGSLRVDARTGPVGQTLRDLTTHAAPSLLRAGVTLEVEIPADLTARFDRDALARIIGNLLDNAEKYSRGAVDRTIRVEAAVGDHVVEIRVEDHGPGVHDRARLFRPFVRGASSLADDPPGLGLGLALSRTLARAMGGDLTHHPSNAGAVFVLRLPAS